MTANCKAQVIEGLELLLSSGVACVSGEFREWNDSYVYFIREKRTMPAVKVGYTTSPGRRIQDLQTASPYSLELFAVFGPFENKDAHYLERQLHYAFRHARLQGEWFKSSIIQIMSEASMYSLSPENYDYWVRCTEVLPNTFDDRRRAITSKLTKSQEES